MINFVNDANESINVDAEFALTKRAMSFSYFKIVGDASVNYNLPNNSDTRRILGYYGLNQVSSPALSKQLFRVFKDGFELSRGYIVVQRDLGAVLDCYFIAGNANWINQLNFNFKDVENENYTIKWSSANISTYQTATTGISFPFVDYLFNGQRGGNYFFIRSGYTGTLGATADTTDQLADCFPAIYMSSLFQAITYESGIKFSGDLFSDQLFNSLMVTHDGPDLLNSANYVERRHAKIGAESQVMGFIATKINFTNVIFNGTRSPYNTGTIRYTADSYCELSFVIYLSLSINQSYTVSIYKNGISAIARTGGQVCTITYDYLQASPGDYFEIYIQGATPYSVGVSSFLEVMPTAKLAPTTTGISPYVRLSTIAPNMLAVDLVKWAAVSFGCDVVFNTYANSITINKIDNKAISSALNWSDYLNSFEIKYDLMRTNTYLRLAEATEPQTVAYNERNELKFGECVFTGNDSDNSVDVYTSPFPATDTLVSNNQSGYALPFIDFYGISDDVVYTYASVTNVGGGCQFNGTFTDIAGSSNVSFIIRIVDDRGIYSGYFITDSAATATSTTILISSLPYVSTSTGTIYIQTHSRKTPGARVISVTPLSPSSFSNLSSVTSDSWTLTSVLWGSYVKPVTGLAIDKIPTGLNYGPINKSGYTFPSLTDLYFDRITSMLSNPPIRAKMLLPESSFRSFNFELIYLKTEKFSGYFYVDSIVNYQGGDKEVEVNLLMI